MDEESIFAAAIALEPTEARAAFLDEACGGDQQLRSRVEALINSHENAGSFLHEPAVAASPTVDQAPLERPGTQIGPYRLLEKLGEGGMGVVFLAEQKEPVERQVALKIIRPGMDTQRVIDRFEAERQALAVMDHPNVAKVLDAGSTDSGRPYFVMELVRGTRITQYCDEHQLSVRERLELFIPVCQAVQHAHQKGIIHRDIKPSNILVAEFDGRPVPKVIDFGVAKAMDQGAAQKQLSTQYGQIVGTLEYMSPEQARLSSHDIDTRSDVYSLGAVLYELLTGITPFDKHKLYSAAFDQALHMIEAEEPPKPSLRLSSSESLPSVAALRTIEPQRLMGLIRGELDWIVMKALEKERSRRYDSAASLAQDIDHYLHDQPVLAGPPSRAYRFHKFARRNKSMLATTAFVAVALVVGTGVATWQAMRAHAQATRAEGEKARAQATLRMAVRAVDEMYIDVAEKHVTATPMAEPMRVQLLEGAIRFYTSFSTIHASDRGLRRERAKAYSRLGRCQRWLGQLSEAETAQETAIWEFEQLIVETPSVPDHQVELAGCCVELGEMLGSRAQHSRAELLFERALALLQPLQATMGDDPDYQFRLACAHWAQGEHYAQVKRYDEAEEHIRKAAALCERLAADSPDDVQRRFHLARTYRSLAEIFEATKQTEDAAAYYTNSIDMQQQVVARPPVDPDDRLILSETYSAYAQFLEHSGRLNEAEETYSKSLHVSAALAEDFPYVPHYRDSWRSSYYCLGQFLSRSNRFGCAERMLGEVIALAEDLVAQWPMITSFQQQLATAYVDCGYTLFCTGQLRDAERRFRQALSLAEKLDTATPNVPENIALLARVRDHLGQVLEARKGLPEAEQTYRRTMSVNEQLVDDYPDVPAHRLQLSVSQENLANVLRAMGRLDESERYFRKCVTIQESLVEEDIEQYANLLAITYTKFGDMLTDAHRDEDATQNYRHAMTLYERLVSEYPKAVIIRDQMRECSEKVIREANTRYSRGDNSAGEMLLGEVLEVGRRVLGPEHPDMLRLLDSIANVNFRHGRHTDAHKLYAEELEIRRRAKGNRLMPARMDFDDLNNMNQLAWFLVTCPDVQIRAPREAVTIATEIVELWPGARNTLGAAQYRVGDYAAAIETLEKAKTLNVPLLPFDLLFLSMAYWQLGNSTESQQCFDEAVEAVERMEKNGPFDPLLQLVRAEAAELLELNETPQSVENPAAQADGTTESPDSAVETVPDAMQREEKWRQEREAKATAAEPVPPAASKTPQAPPANKGG